MYIVVFLSFLGGKKKPLKAPKKDKGVEDEVMFKSTCIFHLKLIKASTVLLDIFPVVTFLYKYVTVISSLKFTRKEHLLCAI